MMVRVFDVTVGDIAYPGDTRATGAGEDGAQPAKLE